MTRNGPREERNARPGWPAWGLVVLGVWLAFSGASILRRVEPMFAHSSFATAPIARPAGDRPIGLSDAARVHATGTNDLVCGGLLLAFGVLSAATKKRYWLGLAAATGVWLNLAPLVFWAPTARIYLNETLTGVLATAFGAVVPSFRRRGGAPAFGEYGSFRPPGFSFNPSGWQHRAILVLIVYAAWMIARAMGMFQLGYLRSIWDPLFDGGTPAVLTSALSRALPVADAGLGAFAYTLEFLLILAGGPARWREAPGTVFALGLLIAATGIASVALLLAQPLVVRRWCGPCLATAALMLSAIPLDAAEVRAAWMSVSRSRRAGVPLRKALWKGGP